MSMLRNTIARRFSVAPGTIYDAGRKIVNKATASSTADQKRSLVLNANAHMGRPNFFGNAKSEKRRELASAQLAQSGGVTDMPYWLGGACVAFGIPYLIFEYKSWDVIKDAEGNSADPVSKNVRKFSRKFSRRVSGMMNKGAGTEGGAVTGAAKTESGGSDEVKGWSRWMRGSVVGTGSNTVHNEEIDIQGVKNPEEDEEEDGQPKFKEAKDNKEVILNPPYNHWEKKHYKAAREKYEDANKGKKKPFRWSESTSHLKRAASFSGRKLSKKEDRYDNAAHGDVLAYNNVDQYSDKGYKLASYDLEQTKAPPHSMQRHGANLGHIPSPHAMVLNGPRIVGLLFTYADQGMTKENIKNRGMGIEYDIKGGMHPCRLHSKKSLKHTMKGNEDDISYDERLTGRSTASMGLRTRSRRGDTATCDTSTPAHLKATTTLVRTASGRVKMEDSETGASVVIGRVGKDGQIELTSGGSENAGEHGPEFEKLYKGIVESNVATI